MMGWRIVNRTPQLLIVPLNSGRAVHLAPNETSPLLEHAEINGNAKVDKLLAKNSITLVQEKMQETAAAPAKGRRGATQPAQVAHKIEPEQGSEHEPEREREHKKK